ncbi:MAG TPA: RluA family pseudouridine synthase [Gaiellaceae bacterium]|nr:RluA family pseudouridine synthase [Gaiellaceae bacterium]
MSGVGSTEPPGSEGAGFAGAGSGLDVPAGAAGQRLDRFLADVLGTRAAAERAVAAGALVDGVARPKSHRLAGGEQVTLAPEEPEPVSIRHELPDVRLAYEDEHVLVVDKPAGLVVHPGAGHAGDTLVDALRGKIAGGDPDRPGIVHRLDRDTSGLIAVARTEEAHEALSLLVRERALERTYLALVRGRPRSRRGRIEAPIGRDRGDPTRIALDSDSARAAVTHFEVDRLYERHALLRVRLETGRMHQIRVHLAAIDLPVVGDPTYGVPDPALGRQFLHAAELSFPHPITGARIEATSPLPPDLELVLSRNTL